VQCEVWGRWWIGLLVARLGRVFTRNSEKIAIREVAIELYCNYWYFGICNGN
jgi:hypothetical protein